MLFVKKSPYGRHDTDRLTAELERFQQQVAKPELAAKGYPEEQIDRAFEANREALVRAVVVEVRER